MPKSNLIQLFRPIIICMAISILGMVILPGCLSQTPSPNDLSVSDNAALEATEMIQKAEATALVIRAKAQATIIVLTAEAPAEAAQAPTDPISVPEDNTTRQFSTPTAKLPTRPTQTIISQTIVLFGVHIGGDGGFINVEFTAPPPIVAKWYDGSVYVIDELTGIKYKDIPVMPVIGPLFAKPKIAGQGGYVMFYNLKNAIKPGSVLTVVLGDFKAEHVIVQ